MFRTDCESFHRRDFLQVGSAGGNTPTGVVLFYLDGVLQTQTASWTLDGSSTATSSLVSTPVNARPWLACQRMMAWRVISP